VERAQAGSPATEHANASAVIPVASTTLSVGVSASDTLFQVSEAAMLGMLVGRYYQIDDEIILLTNLTDNNATVVRAQESTTAAGHETNTSIIVVERSKILMGRVTSASATQILVHSASDAQMVPGSKILIDSEIMNVTAVVTDVATVERAQAGTTAATHADGAVIASVVPLFNVAGVPEATGLFGLGAAWQQAAGTLTMSLLPAATLLKDTEYAVSFHLKNPTREQAAVTASIAIPLLKLPWKQTRT
jgi:hypothetical protein